jgi:hypothetical protein
MTKYLPDVLLIAGAASVSFGAWLAWHPAGFLVAGALCIYAGIKTAGK